MTVRYYSSVDDADASNSAKDLELTIGDLIRQSVQSNDDATINFVGARGETAEENLLPSNNDGTGGVVSHLLSANAEPELATSSSPPSGGVHAGSVVGGLAAAALVVFFVVRRSRRGRSRRNDNEADRKDRGGDFQTHDGVGSYHEDYDGCDDDDSDVGLNSIHPRCVMSPPSFAGNERSCCMSEFSDRDEVANEEADGAGNDISSIVEPDSNGAIPSQVLQDIGASQQLGTEQQKQEAQHQWLNRSMTSETDATPVFSNVTRGLKYGVFGSGRGSRGMSSNLGGPIQECDDETDS